MGEELDFFNYTHIAQTLFEHFFIKTKILNIFGGKNESI